MRLATCPGMFLAHLPAGYLLTRFIERRSRTSGLLAVGLAASVVPDLDLARFYLLDHRRVLHHAYGTHEPFWWALVALVWFAGVRLRGWRRGAVAGAIFFGNVLLHLVLDTVAGGIRWLAPFSDRGFVVFAVPARHGWWVWNFVLHWTFVAELSIAAWALAAAIRHRCTMPRATELARDDATRRAARSRRRRSNPLT